MSKEKSKNKSKEFTILKQVLKNNCVKMGQKCGMKPKSTHDVTSMKRNDTTGRDGRQ